MCRLFVLFIVVSLLGQAQSSQLPGTNIGFESSAVGSYTAANGVTGWTLSSTTASNCNQYTFVPGANEFSLTNTPILNHPIIGNISNSPLGGSVVAVLNNTQANNKVTRLSQKINLPSSGDYWFKFSYAGVWQDGGHSCCAQAKLSLILRDSTMQVLDCKQLDLAGANCYLSANSNSVNGNATFCNWKTIDIDLGQYAGQKIFVEIVNSDCGFGDHYGTAYVDCSIYLNLNQVFTCPYGLSQPIIYCANASSIALYTGYTGTFTWTVPQGYTLSASQATTSPLIIQNPISGSVFSLTINPYCAPATCTIQAANLQSAGVATSSTCVGGSVGSISVALNGPPGPYSYTYTSNNFYAATTQSVLANLPAGIYTVQSAVTSNTGCGIVTQTAQIGQLPILVYSTVQPFCAGASSIFINRPGGSNYQWYNGSTAIPAPQGNASSLTINTPTNGQLVRLKYHSPQGCQDSSTIIISAVQSGSLIQSSLKPPCINQTNGVAVFTLYPANAFTTSYTYYHAPTGSNTAAQTSLNALATSFTVNNLSAGIYSVTAYDAVCAYQYTYAVQQATLNYFLSTIRDTICSGASIAVFANVPNAPNGSYTFSWQPTTYLFNNLGNLQSTIITPTVTSNNSLSIVYTVVVTPTINVCSFTQTFQLVTYNLAHPTIAPVPSTLCVNSPTIQLQGAPSGGFFSATTPSALSAAGIFDPSKVNSGWQKFSYYVKKGNCVVSDTVSAKLILTSFTLPSQYSICSGQSVALSAQGAQSYTWNNGSNNSSLIVSPIQTTSYSVIGLNGVCPNTFSTTVMVVALPTLAIEGPSVICFGETTTLTASGQGNFNWTNGGIGPIVIVSPTVTTQYTLTLTAITGCSNTVSKTVEVGLCDGISETVFNQLNVYLNHEDKLIVDVEPASLSVRGVRIFDLEGRLINQFRYMDQKSAIEFGILNRGCYTIEVEFEGGIYLRRKVLF